MNGPTVRLPVRSRWRGRLVSRRPCPFMMEKQTEARVMAPLVDRTLALRRQMLVAALFKHAAEVQELEDGYAFRFKRSDLVTRRIADYVLFEGWHSPQLTFTMIVEPHGRGIWLHVRGPAGEQAGLRRVYASVLQAGVQAGEESSSARR